MKDIQSLISALPSSIVVVGVSKNRSLDQIESLYKQGITVFGENKAQELQNKADPSQPWQWHFIGHLQTNKVKQVVKHCSMIHSVDSLKLAQIIDKECAKINKIMDVCIQVNVINEATKSGCKIAEVNDLALVITHLNNINLKGIMVMGPTDQDDLKIHQAFKLAQDLFESLKKTHPQVDTLSMGMSQDYQVAIQYGSTMLRLGSILFE